MNGGITENDNYLTPFDTYIHNNEMFLYTRKLIIIYKIELLNN